MAGAFRGREPENAPQENGGAMAEESMANWLSDEYLYREPKRGEMREAVVLAIRPDEILVDLGVKRTGVVQERDLDRLDPEIRDALKPGATTFVYVLRPDLDGEVLVSVNMAQSMRDWQQAEEYMRDGTIFEAEVTGFNRGGLLIQFGRVQGFIPSSQVVAMRRNSRGQEHESMMQAMVGQTLPLKVIEVDHNRRRLILSERQARREWQRSQRIEFLEELHEGQVRKGIVNSFCDFGAFVSLGPMDGLIHISELSWDRVRDPSEVLELGQEVEVYVLSVDRERERIALSLKQLQEDPWVGMAEKYVEGQLVEGTVTNVLKFGAFVSLDTGIEGLVHGSELDDRPVSDPADVVVIDETLLLRILHVDLERHRIALSLRQVTAQDRENWYVPKDDQDEPEQGATDGREEDESDF